MTHLDLTLTNASIELFSSITISIQLFVHQSWTRTTYKKCTIHIQSIHEKSRETRLLSLWIMTCIDKKYYPIFGVVKSQNVVDVENSHGITFGLWRVCPWSVRFGLLSNVNEDYPSLWPSVRRFVWFSSSFLHQLKTVYLIDLVLKWGSLHRYYFSISFYYGLKPWLEALTTMPRQYAQKVANEVLPHIHSIDDWLARAPSRCVLLSTFLYKCLSIRRLSTG